MSNEPENFYDWLKTQSDGFQDQAIGIENAGQLRSGELTSERFYKAKMHKTFEPMTLDDMRRAEE